MLTREMALYKELQEKGTNVTLVTYGDSSDRDCLTGYPGIEVIPIYTLIKRRQSRFARLFVALVILPVRLLPHIKKADIYKTKQMLGGWLPMMLSVLTKKPYVFRTGYDYLYFHRRKNGSKLVYSVLKKVMSQVIKRSTIVLVSSEQDKLRMQGYCKSCDSKVIVVPNWVDTLKFNDRHESRYNDRVLFVGRLSEQKNLYLLIDAITEIGFGLDIVGEGELGEAVKEYASEKSCKVNFLGLFSNDELADVYNRYSIYVLVSRYEGNPKTLLEAMSCELAVIGTNVEGIREVINNGVTGLLVEEDVTSVKLAFKKLINDVEFRKTLGQNARDYILKNNSLSSYVEFELGLYKKILAKI